MTQVDAPDITDELLEPVITDVWSRTTSKYRTRAIVLLIVNTVLFAGLGCFAFWLRTGRAFAPAMDGYWSLLGRTFLPRGDATLANFVVFPINLEAVPAHGLVVGLLLAALVAIPILIAMLYRFPCCLPFLLVVAFLAVMPWLAINLAGACILATIKPLRFRFRYASALLGLLLVVLYFYGASRETAALVDIHKPEDRIKFMAPWILAALASCLIMGGVLFLARVVNYRPGVIAPLLLLSFAVPVVMFEKYVGRDELRYRLLEREFQDRFSLTEHQLDQDVSEWFLSIVRQRWEAEPEPRPPFEAVRDLLEFRLALELDAETNQRSAFAEMRQDTILACDKFIRSFPDSRYAPNVLYFKGEILDIRIDLAAFKEKKIIRYYDDFPTPRSEFAWKRVVANAPPDSKIAAVGLNRLAVFKARAGNIDEAIRLLDDLLVRTTQENNAATENGGSVKDVLESKPADANLRIQVDRVVNESRQFRDLLANNAHDPAYGVRPFIGSKRNEPRQVGLLQLDPRHPRYADNLLKLMEAYPDCLLTDNIELRRVLATTDIDEKIDLLAACIEDYPNGDARPEAMFRLGVALMETNSITRGRESLGRLIRDYPNDTTWTPLAMSRLRGLPAVPAEKGS